MPTDKPRYAITDTGEVSRMLDAAQERWPEVRDRKSLLLKLAELGGATVLDESRRERQREALAHAPERVDVELLLGDAAWQ
jgi:hypothetical protein